MREREPSPQERQRRIQALLARGKAIQDSYQSQKLLKEQLDRAREGHAAWVRHQNELKQPGYKEQILAQMAEEYAAKQAKEDQEAAIQAQLRQYEGQLRAK